MRFVFFGRCVQVVMKSNGECEGRGPCLVEGTDPQELRMEYWHWRRGGKDAVKSETQEPLRMLRLDATFCMAFEGSKIYLLLQYRVPH